MNYKVGDTVICIDSRGGRNIPGVLILGKEYVVRSLNATCVSMEGVRNNKFIGNCCTCNDISSDGHWHFYPWRFIKLDKLTEEHEEEAFA